jgi:hypothetical protein
MLKKAVNEVSASLSLVKRSPMLNPSRPNAFPAMGKPKTYPFGISANIRFPMFPAITATPFIPGPEKI